MASLHPDHGARVVLEREAVEGEVARYRVQIYEPAAVTYGTHVTLSAEAVETATWEREPPPWIGVFVERLLKTFAKSHAGGPWPRKVTRWREER